MRYWPRKPSLEELTAEERVTHTVSLLVPAIEVLALEPPMVSAAAGLNVTPDASVIFPATPEVPMTIFKLSKNPLVLLMLSLFIATAEVLVPRNAVTAATEGASMFTVAVPVTGVIELVLMNQLPIKCSVLLDKAAVAEPDTVKSPLMVSLPPKVFIPLPESERL